MKVSYRRDLNHNYLIMENDRVTGREYTVRMVEQNTIPQLLRFQVRKMNGKTYLYYEITSRQPVSQVFESCSMSSRDIRQLLEGIRGALNYAHQYLLDNKDILLNPDYIYMDIETRKMQFCYVPFSGEEERDDLVSLSEFILKKLDHADREAVELGYELFGQISRENFSLQETLKTLLQGTEKRGYRRKTENMGKTDEEPGEMLREGGDDDVRKKDERKIVEWNKRKKKEYSGGREWKNSAGSNGMCQEAYAGNGEKQAETSGRRISKIAEDSKRKKKSRAASVKADGNKGDSCGKKNGKTEKEVPGGKEEKTYKRKRMEKSFVRHNGRKLLAGFIVLTVVLLIFCLIVYFGKLDLTQIGGLAFLFLAVLWIIYSMAAGKKEKTGKQWMEDDTEDDEDAFMEALLSEVYQKESENLGIPQGAVYGMSPEDELCGETRCLAVTEYEKPLRLVSLEPDQYQDIVMDKDKAFVGKKKNQADIWLGIDSVSRIHAKLEKSGEEYFVTDMNSMNGTFLNGERLKPNEKRQFYAGDRISFATLHYKVKKQVF